MHMLVVGVLLVLSFVEAQTPPPIVEISTLSTTSQVYDLLIAKNGKSLAAFCKDRRIRQWSLPQGQLLRTIDTHGRNVTLVLVSDDGRILVADRDGTLMAWDATDASAAFQTKLPRYRAASFFRASPNTAVFSHSGKYLALSALTDAMQVLEWPSGRSLYILNSPPGGTSAVAFSRDDSRIAAAGTDGILRIYDSSSGKLVAQNEDLLGESFAIDFSADGREVVAGGADKAAIFVDTATGKLIRRIGPLADVVAYLAISPDGKHLSAALLREETSALPAPVLVWHAASGKKVAEWTPPGAAFGAAWSQDGHWLVVTSTPTALHVWRVY
jgi:WD40 repeat protein